MFFSVHPPITSETWYLRCPSPSRKRVHLSWSIPSMWTPRSAKSSHERHDYLEPKAATRDSNISQRWQSVKVQHWAVNGKDASYWIVKSGVDVRLILNALSVEMPALRSRRIFFNAPTGVFVYGDLCVVLSKLRISTSFSDLIARDPVQHASHE